MNKQVIDRATQRLNDCWNAIIVRPITPEEKKRMAAHERMHVCFQVIRGRMTRQQGNIELGWIDEWEKQQ
jgi:hypothetical protein